MPKQIRRTKPVTPVGRIRNTKEYRGFSVMSDDEDNVTITAFWMVPREDGTIDKVTEGVLAEDIMAIPGFDDVVDAIVAATE